MALWLIKEEPSHYSYVDLERERKTRWDGVANNLALQHLRAVAKGDLALFYESGGVKAAVGIVEAASGPYPDPAEEDTRLVVIDVRPVEKLPRPVALAEIKEKLLFAKHPLVRIPRLSVMPLSAAEWKAILALAGKRKGR